MHVRIGTRGSKLALWQARLVQRKLEEAGLQSEIVEIETVGDQVQSVPLHEVGGVGLFTKALDKALMERAVDIAVHSAKDIPSVIEDELEIIAFLEREDPRDVLLATSEEVSLENLSRSWVVGTSSLRRSALLKNYFRHVEVKDIRGNVDTRVDKLESGAYDAIMLAYAGVKRMGFESLIVQKFNIHSITSAVGQGAIAIMASKKSKYTDAIQSILNHRETELALRCERSFLRTIEGGCKVPVFGYAHVQGGAIYFHGGMAREDGSEVFREKVEGAVENGIKLGNKVAQVILNQVNS
ncbi:MAG: hydroxymethylbilane synthase [Bacteroidota bacterium]